MHSAVLDIVLFTADSISFHIPGFAVCQRVIGIDPVIQMACWSNSYRPTFLIMTKYTKP